MATSRTVGYRIGELDLEWDAQKAESNLDKHGISFQEGATVFQDRKAILLEDPGVYDDEVRLVLLGYSRNAKLLIVVNVARGFKLRLISVRPATKSERRVYEENEKC